MPVLEASVSKHEAVTGILHGQLKAEAGLVARM